MILSDEVILAWQRKLKLLNVTELAWLYYLAPIDWEVFCNYPLYSFLMNRMLELGFKEKRNWRGPELQIFISEAIDSGRLFGLLARPLDNQIYKLQSPDVLSDNRYIPPQQNTSSLL